MHARQRLTVAAMVLGLIGGGRAGLSSEVVQLEVDARQAPARLLAARIVLPAQPGPLRLVYPKWIQAQHAPVGPIADVAGLEIRAAGKTISWRRDPVDMFAFDVVVPEGVEAVEVSLDYLSPAPPSRATATANLAIVLWHQLLLYPEGTDIAELVYQPAIRLPKGWGFASALEVEAQRDDRVEFKPCSLEMLADSILYTGRYHKTYAIGPTGGRRHAIFAVAESADELEMSPAYRRGYDRLIAEAQAMFGAQPYEAYTFLVALSNHIAHTGLEHHQSSDNRVLGRSFADDQLHLSTVRLLPHEYVHSWNGKFRRPATMTHCDFQQPLETELLWVYEGLTRYLDRVLTARSGLFSQQDAQASWAGGAQAMLDRKGRSWRPLMDTTVAAPILYGARSDRANWRRGVDFYNEGAFVWLDVDTLIRQRSGGKRSLDDFLRAFFGEQDGLPSPLVKTYTLDDVVAALDAVEAHDWRSLFEERVAVASDQPPLAGLERGGWRLGYGSEPSAIQQAKAAARKVVNLSASLGISIDKNALVVDVVPDSPAERAGVAPGMKLVAVNSRRYTPEGLKSAVRESKSPDARIDLLLENRDIFSTYELDYHGGAKYPRLERIADSPDLLSEIHAPRTWQP